MANIRLTIQHGDKIYEPPVEEGVQIEWERNGTPGKLTFTTVKTKGLSFSEGDRVCFYYDDKLAFVGYVFTKSRDREHHIKVTCYDQLRYLKNKFTYVFEKKTATQIIKSLCDDFNLNIGELDDTSYVIPTIVEENKSAFDIVLNVLEETLVNTGDMYVLYDDCGSIKVKDIANMKSSSLICEDTAENFNYSTSIDDETYNSIVLYYDANSNSASSSGSSDSTGAASSDADKILTMARSQIGTSENPSGSNNVKYNTEYYGGAVSGSAYPWCCAFVWWVFKQCGLSSLFNGGAKTAYCPTAENWFKARGQWVTGNYKPGDVIFFNWSGGKSNADHIGFVESANGSQVTCIEGNYSNTVARVVRTSGIIGAGRPAYSSASTRSASSSTTSGSTSTLASSITSGGTMQLYTASSPTKIKEWGLLRYFEKVSSPSIGQNKANALLKLYNKRTRELKVTGAFGDISVRGGTLIPTKLNLGDIAADNYMLVEKVTHKFNNDYHTMDLTLEASFEDGYTADMQSKTIGEIKVTNTPSTSTGSIGSIGSIGSTGLGYTGIPTSTTTSVATKPQTYRVSVNVIGGSQYGGDIKITFYRNGKQISVLGGKSTMTVTADADKTVNVRITPKNGHSFKIESTTGKWKVQTYTCDTIVKQNSAVTVRWVR